MNNRKHFEHSPVTLTYDNLGDASVPGTRIYVTPSGKKYPSITTILGIRNKEFLMEWRRRVGEKEANRIARHAVARGSALHSIAEKYLNNEEEYFDANTMPHVRGMFNAIQPILDKYVGKILMQEVPLYSDHFGVAGRVDLIAEFNGKRSVIDFKTSSRVKSADDISNYFIQACFYAIATEEQTKLPVSQLVIVMAVENSNKPLVFIEKRDKWVDELWNVKKEYDRLKLFGHA